MSVIKYSILAIAMVLTGFVTAKAQTADEIVQKHIAAIGGADNWKKITSLKMTGSMNAGGMEIPVVINVLHNKGMKVEFTVNGMTGYQLITTKEGWVYSPMQGQTKPEAIPAEMVKEEQDGLDIQGKFIDYKAKGSKVNFLGKDDVEGTECYKLKLTYSSGKEETVFIDASNYYHIRSVTKVKANGKETEQISTFSNFQKLPEGIVFAMSQDDGGGAVAYKTIEVNKDFNLIT